MKYIRAIIRMFRLKYLVWPARVLKRQVISPCIEEIGRRDVVIHELSEVIDLLCKHAHGDGSLTEEEIFAARRRKYKALTSIYRYKNVEY